MAIPLLYRKRPAVLPVHLMKSYSVTYPAQWGTPESPPPKK